MGFEALALPIGVPPVGLQLPASETLGAPVIIRLPRPDVFTQPDVRVDASPSGLPHALSSYSCTTREPLQDAFVGDWHMHAPQRHGRRQTRWDGTVREIGVRATTCPAAAKARTGGHAVVARDDPAAWAMHTPTP